MLEKEIDKYIAGVFQKHKIDFIRIKNSNFKGRMKNFNTTAFSEIFSCDKFWPDFMFCHDGNIRMIENGLKTGNKLQNKERKEMQYKRMNHWHNEGCAGFVIITSIDEAQEYFKNIGIF